MVTPTCSDCGQPIPTDSGFKVTVRGKGVELRGEIVSFETLRALADAVKPSGWMVIASPLEPHEGCHE